MRQQAAALVASALQVVADSEFSLAAASLNGELSALLFWRGRHDAQVSGHYLWGRSDSSGWMLLGQDGDPWPDPTDDLLIVAVRSEAGSEGTVVVVAGTAPPLAAKVTVGAGSEHVLGECVPGNRGAFVIAVDFEVRKALRITALDPRGGSLGQQIVALP